MPFIAGHYMLYHSVCGAVHVQPLPFSSSQIQITVDFLYSLLGLVWAHECHLGPLLLYSNYCVALQGFREDAPSGPETEISD